MPLDPADAGRLRDMVDFAEEILLLLGGLDATQLSRLNLPEEHSNKR